MIIIDLSDGNTNTSKDVDYYLSDNRLFYLKISYKKHLLLLLLLTLYITDYGYMINALSD